MLACMVGVHHGVCCNPLTAAAMLLVLQAFDSLELTEEKINAITDQIPQKPVTIVEGTSYMAIIIAAFTVSMQRSRHSSGDDCCRQCS